LALVNDGDHLPRSIGGYPVEGLLGVGGMGRVYAARDDALGRTVAIKRLAPELAQNPEMCARFLREARAMARINSPHVVTVFGVGEEQGVPFFVMEVLSGEDLSARVQRKGPERPALAIQHLTDAVDGLQAALAAGIIHRDVKPANLFLVADQVKLTDFGLARPLEPASSPRLTQAGLVVGTPHYIAPEVARGVEATVQSDMYSLGATLFELVTGHPPYEAEASVDVISMHLNDPVPDLTKAAPEIPDMVARLVKRLMAKDPKDRFRDYPALREELIDLGQQFTRLSPQRRGPRITPSMPPSVAEVDMAAARSSTDEVTEPPTGIPMPRLSDPNIRSVKTANLAVMVTDIAGYAERTGQQSREEAARWLKLHEQLLSPVFKGFRGKVVKTIGDAFLVTFGSPTDAVLCGMAIQDRLWFHNQTARAEEQIRVCVAISAGEVRLHKGDIFGEAVNLAARVETLAKPGDVLLTDAVYATMNTAEASLELRGEHTFKGINRAVSVYTAVPEGLEGQPPFGGRALAQVPSLWMRLKGSVGRGLGRIRGTGASTVNAPAPRGPSAFVMGAAVAAVLAGLGIGLLVSVLAVDPRIARIDQGGAEAVLKEIALIPKEERSGGDNLVKGHAYFELKSYRLAIRAYGQAIEQDTFDDRAVDNLFEALSFRKPFDAVEVLGRWPDSDIEARLLDTLGADDWNLRHHALEVLDARSVATNAHREKVAIVDVTKGTACKTRKRAVEDLAEVATSEASLEVLREAASHPKINYCMVDELNDTIAVIEKRRASAKKADAETPAEGEKAKDS
jgi:serine/threonine protein kinase